ncbi:MULTISPECIES: helix-turn-helix transcriptional regulator [unclassified Tenacibaculum]|uniref:helix-turn-helix transcriptional regulator n=1 Tax=unclassified Tenacibaculum TaxID=2635139 RepID=UPI001F3F5A46|nr:MULTISPECIES: YafY family protein [unclassified Tenacibaculum]MCF2873949.1 YafY family transcriptional regulator [Tenacibaculum sp. Cn5-1]MCF2934530.1 YafY family transcriptional regulator [Tenacibaculum sp. Cn5-34]MCG7510740.1 YafY family transcriptional regulator [Tenacibaculum sp. Cn5-46]
MEKPRLSRLTQLVTMLQSKRLITARELAEKFHVSIRTIYRDIRTLENSGVPIVTEEGKGYFLQEGYQLPPVMFSEEEANALITAEQLIIKNKDTSFVENYSNAITKIKAVLKYSQKDKADLLSKRIVFRFNQEKEQSSNYLMQLQTAITNFQLLEIEYHSLQNKTTKRFVEPFAMYSTNLNWLLIAFCRLRNEFRAFRIDCIQKVVVTGEYFESHNMTLEDYFKMYIQKYSDTPDKPLS